MDGAFRGEFENKVDGKGRVSIPAEFRRVLQAEDPNWTEGLPPQLVIVYGDERRPQLECFTMNAIGEVDAKIRRLPRGSARRRALQRLYHGQALTTAVDETGRLVLPQKLREKLGLTGIAFFIGNGDTFEIWKPETFETESALAFAGEDGFDPDVDPSVYLDGDMEG